jgi:6,7-dimethyl-8-ribityllumazine synthase
MWREGVTTVNWELFDRGVEAYSRHALEKLVRAAKAELARARVRTVKVVRVPGAFEIPVVVARLARDTAKPFAAILCLGVVLRGETAHAQFIGEAVTQALARIQVDYGVPVIHEVLLLENVAQARTRCLDPRHNRGHEAAQTALAMARVMAEVAGTRAKRFSRG